LIISGVVILSVRLFV